MNTDGGSWIPIIEDVDNTGTYTWDLMDPYVEDGEYILKVMAWNEDDGYSFSISEFSIHIVNKKRPEVELQTVLEGKEVSGCVKITWDVIDEDTHRYLISSTVYISDDGGQNYEQLESFREDPGQYVLDTTVLSNGDDYRFRVRVTDQDGFSDEETTNRFFVFNNHIPTVKFTTLKNDDGLFGNVRLEWDAQDIDDPSEMLVVSLWYLTVHDCSKVYLLKDAPNHGYYEWDTSKVKSGPQGHFISIEVIDSRGTASFIDEVKVWIMKDSDRIFEDIDYSRGIVEDRIDITWKIYKPAGIVANELVIQVYHQYSGGEWALIDDGLPNEEKYSLEVTDDDDGFHMLKIAIMDPKNILIYDEFEIQVQVSHQIEPEIYIRKNPMNGTNATGVMEFEVAGFDGNGDVLTYMGLYSIKGGGWQIFESKYGNYKQVLQWNTTGLPPGTYEVRIAVYDGSFYNLSTSKTLGPYFIEDNSPPPVHEPMDLGSDGGLSLIVFAIIFCGIVLVFVTLGFGYVIRKERRKVTSRDIDTLRMSPEYIDTFIKERPHKRRTRRIGFLEKLLPPVGGASDGRLITQDVSISLGWNEEERARFEGYLDMLDPDLVDDVTRSDINSYEILGVNRSATHEEIRNAYIGYVKRYHPDKLIGKDEKLIRMAQEKLRKENRAKAILLDPQKRALVDKMIRENESGRLRDLSVRSIDEIRSLRRK
jgi:DnaJ-domain-containing protein 1